MASESKKQHRLQFFLGPLVAGFILLFALTKAYERAELVTYDWRFNIRNSLFGLPPMDPRLGTIEIDDQSVEVEGRYQDWTRDKYTDVVRLLGEYGARLVGFDVYFIEPSARIITEQQVRELKEINGQAIEELLTRSDYDALFRQAIVQAGNVYLAQYLVIQGEEAAEAQLPPLEADQQEALEFVLKNSPRLMVPPRESTIRRAIHFEPPLKLLRQAARGFAYAQTVTDVDGARRRYPLVYQYGDVVSPSIALLMVCDHLQVPIARVEVWPGQHIRLPRAHLADGRVKDIEIPIDAQGNMNVNWAGRWEDTFVRYPHIALRRAAQREERQRVLDKVRELVAFNPALRSNPRDLPQALAQEGFVDPNANKAAIITWLQATGIEAAVRRNPDMDGAAFWRAKGVTNPLQEQLDMFDQVRRNHRVAALLEKNPEISLEDLHRALPEYAVDDLLQSRYFVRAQLADGQLAESARPLYFYPYRMAQDRLITPDELRDRILFYGLTSTGSTDLSVTPFQGDYPMVGIYSNVLNTILQGKFIRRMPAWFNGLLVLVLGLAMSLIVPRLKVLQGAALIAGLVLLYAVFALFSFTHFGLWLEVVAPMLAIVIGYLALTIYGYVIKEQEKEFVQGAFGHYLSPAVVEQIMENPAMVNQLGGEERFMTAFFSDIASFSTISECLTPRELVDFINDYLTEMCEIIENYGGTIDKFEGDAIVAFFGAPLYFEDHATRAIMACIDQQRKLVELRQRWCQDGAIPARLEQLRQRWESQGRTFAQVRIGLTSGPMIVGNMGSRTRTDYTMMGDTVNLAARFESGQRIYGTNIMVNDTLYEQVKDLVEARRLDLIQVMGKEEPVAAYEVLERKGQLGPEKLQVLDLFNQGLAAYSEYQFIEAKRFFEQALKLDPRDGPSDLYVDRCEEYALQPPQDLIFRAQSK
jgi:adenylate cyclase